MGGTEDLHLCLSASPNELAQMILENFWGDVNRAGDVVARYQSGRVIVPALDLQPAR